MKSNFKYMQLYEELLGKIRGGEYRPGDRIPSQRNLMALYGLSFATVTSGLSALARDNYIVIKHGDGTFVSERPGAARDAAAASANGLSMAVFLQGRFSAPAGFLKGIYDESHESGARLEFICYSGEKMRREKCRALLAGDIPASGCLLLHLPGYDDAVATFRAANFPYVIVDAPCRHEGMNQILLDHAKAAETAVRHLIDHGHERIGLIGGPLQNGNERDYWSFAKLQGYRKAMADAGIQDDEALVCELPEYSDSATAAAVKALLSRAPFSALFVASSNVVRPTIDALAMAGKRVPHDVALIGFNINEVIPDDECPLSGMDVPREAAGRVAVRLLSRIINGTAIEPPYVEEVPIPLIRGRTCGCA